MGVMKATGQTLIELLVTLAIAGVLLGVALPSFTAMLANRRSTAAVNQLIGTVHLARNYAITHHATVTLCPGTESACLGRDSWHLGALLFIDRNINGNFDVGESLLRQLPPHEDARVYWRSFGNKPVLRFVPRGYTRWQNGNFLYCPHNGKPRDARMIILNAQGRVRIARDGDGDGIVEDASGRPVRCP